MYEYSTALYDCNSHFEVAFVEYVCGLPIREHFMTFLSKLPMPLLCFHTKNGFRSLLFLVLEYSLNSGPVPCLPKTEKQQFLALSL